MDELKANTPESQDNTTEHSNERKNSGGLSDLTISKTESPPPPSEQCHPYHWQYPPKPWWRRLNWQLIVELMVFVVAVKVAFIYSGQLDQMKRTNDITEGFQRPWVGVKIDKIRVDFGAVDVPVRTLQGLQIERTIHNYGTSPAVNLLETFEYLHDDSRPDSEKTQSLCRAPVPSPYNRKKGRPAELTAFPNGDITGRTPVDHRYGEQVEYGAWDGDSEIVGCISYLSPHSVEPRFTKIICRFKMDKSIRTGEMIAECPIPIIEAD